MSWRQFELLCGEAFRRKGYLVEENGLGGADGGVDLILRAGGERVLVQCKRWQTFKVGVREVRELFGILAADHADRAVFVSSGAYTAEDQTFAKGKPLQLIDGHALLELVREVQKHPPSGLDRVGHSRSNPLPIPDSLPPQCPRCGSAMVLRTAKRGSHAGAQFWGCSAYPKCRCVLRVEIVRAPFPSGAEHVNSRRRDCLAVSPIGVPLLRKGNFRDSPDPRPPC